MKKGYKNGSDLLLKINGKPVGHCTEHTFKFSAETKEHAVKPVATAPIGDGFWKERTVTGMSVSINFSGLMFYQETEGGFKTIAAEAFKGKTVEVECFEREGDEKPYATGSFVISSMEHGAPAQDDATYSGQLDNSGKVEFDPEGMTEGEPAAA